MKCSNCLRDTLEVKKGNYIEGNYTIKNTQWEECSHCGEKYFGPEILDGLTKAYYVNNNLLLPKEIKKRREDCGKTQKELGDAMDVSANSIKRWEKGSYIQPDDKNIRLEEVLGIWENHKLENLTVKSWIDSIRRPEYVPCPAFAAHTTDNEADTVKKTKKLIEKLKK
jgi:YgiT-type zinc finger domain-containing protein